jgi:hypothetical protein
VDCFSTDFEGVTEERVLLGRKRLLGVNRVGIA